MEMEIKEHYFEVLDVLDRLFVHMFDGFNERFGERSPQHSAAPTPSLSPAGSLPLLAHQASCQHEAAQAWHGTWPST